MANLISDSNVSRYANKGELADANTHFCIMDAELTDGEFGERWELDVFLASQEELKTISFARNDKRDELFSSMQNDLPQHDCWLVRWSFKGKSGYRIGQRSGGGPCPCTTDAKVSDNPFLPDEPEEEEKKPAPAPTPAPKANTLENAPASPQQYATIGKLSAQLSRDVDMPETYGEAKTLIAELAHDVNRMQAQLNRRETKNTEDGVPLR